MFQQKLPDSEGKGTLGFYMNQVAEAVAAEANPDEIRDGLTRRWMLERDSQKKKHLIRNPAKDDTQGANGTVPTTAVGGGTQLRTFKVPTSAQYARWHAENKKEEEECNDECGCDGWKVRVNRFR